MSSKTPSETPDVAPSPPAREPWSLALLGAGLVAGIYLRWRMVATPRSLWLDPAMLVWNVVERGYLDLWRPLDENQAAPYGFLALLKTAGTLGDYSETSLLVFPFLASIAALFVFSRLALDVLGREGAPFALVPLAFSSTAIYYAGEVKQYSFDLLATALLLWLAWRALLPGAPTRAAWAFGFGAMAMAWLSHTSLLVSATLLALLLAALCRGEQGTRRASFGMAAAVASHHALLYFLQMRPAASQDLFTAHQAYFAPWPPWQAWTWYRDTFAGYLAFPLGYPAAGLLPLTFLALGLLALRKHRREAGLVLLPLLAALVASLLEKYPLPTGEHDIHSRLVLFALPCVCLLIGRGAASLLPVAGKAPIALVLLVALAWPAAQRSFGEPGYLRQEMRPLVDNLRANLEPGDQVYVYYAAEPAFRYYTRKEPIDHLVGGQVDELDRDLRREAARLAPGRVWTVFAHTFREEDFAFRAILEERGRRLVKHMHEGTVLELYELDPPPAP